LQILILRLRGRLGRLRVLILGLRGWFERLG
jgi:hypothetical protein